MCRLCRPSDRRVRTHEATGAFILAERQNYFATLSTNVATDLSP